MTLVSTIPSTITLPALASTTIEHLIALDAINSRKYTTEDIDALALSIEREGLLQPLLVKTHTDGYAIIDGRRRREAILKLVKSKKWDRAALINIVVRPDSDTDALSVSLVANLERLPPHPVDQHETYSALQRQGLTVDKIAARFGQTNRDVQKHLALGDLAPALRKAWRDGTLTAEAAKAFTLTSDHKAQVALFKRLKHANSLSAYSVRQELTQARPNTLAVPPALITLYTANGGTLTTDLFAEMSYVENPDLLASLKADYENTLIDETRATLLGEGWNWIERDIDLPTAWRWNWNRLPRDEHNEALTLTYTKAEEKQRAALAKLADSDDPPEDLDDQFNAIDDQAWLRTVPLDDRARAGAVITLTADSFIEIERGLLKPAPAVATNSDDQELTPHTEDEPVGRDISHSLLNDLHTAQTMAAAHVLAAHPMLALRYALASLSAYKAPLKIRMTGHAAHPRSDTSDFPHALRTTLKLTDEDIIRHLALFVARSTDFVRVFSTAGDEATAAIQTLPGADYLTALRRDFNAENYFRAPRKIARQPRVCESRRGA